MMRCGILTRALALALLTAGAAHAGTVTGTITFEGTPPTMPPLKMDADPSCKAMHGDDPPVNEALVLGEGQTMGNILVQVVEGLPDQEFPAPSEPFVVTQKGCVYSPHVFAVQAGQTVQILNPDGILHNVNVMPRENRPFNKAMPKNLEEIEVVFDTPEEPFPFKCDIHPWMRAYCAVIAHPFFDVTEADGQYTIEGLPAGEYTIQAWHEKLGPQTAKVTVAEDGAATADFTFSR